MLDYLYNILLYEICIDCAFLFILTVFPFYAWQGNVSILSEIYYYNKVMSIISRFYGKFLILLLLIRRIFHGHLRFFSLHENAIICNFVEFFMIFTKSFGKCRFF